MPCKDPDHIIREQLAEYAHEAWSGWMRYLFALTIEVGEGCEEIQREQVERWKRQMSTPYSELPENEKESDRQEADKLAILKAEKCDFTRNPESTSTKVNTSRSNWSAQNDE